MTDLQDDPHAITHPTETLYPPPPATTENRKPRDIFSEGQLVIRNPYTLFFFS